MSQRRRLKRPGLPIKPSLGSVRRVFLFMGISVLLTLSGALPAWAQGEPIGAFSAVGGGFAAMGALSWVQLTFASVVTVLAGWVLATGMIGVAGRLRWVTRHRQNRLARALQVAFGGLLLMAVLLPYLVEHHPIVALMLPMMGILTTFAVGMRTTHLADQNPSH